MGERVGQIAKVPEVKQSNSNSRVRKTERLQSMDTPADRILFLQRTAGNQAVSRLMRSGALQAKLRIGQPGDMYEQEADAVMRMPEPGVQRQVEPEEEEEEEETLQTKTTRGHTPTVEATTHAKIHSLIGSGQPLSPNQRTFFGSRMGHDFSCVRIHDGTQAADTARAVHAKAFTLGNNIVFNTGQYSPNNQEGNKLLAHELTHVVQQGQKQYSKIQKQGEAEAVERNKEFDVFALDLKKAMEPLGTDEEAIFHVLQEARRIPSGMDKLKKAYKKRYKVSLENDLQDEMSGNELSFAFSLLGNKSHSKSLDIKPRSIDDDYYKEAVNRLIKAIEGVGTDEELIYSVLVPFKGAFDSIRKLKLEYKKITKRSLEADLIEEMSGDELEHVSKLLHAPLTPAKGMAERMVAEAEQGNEEAGPGGPCTAVTIKRYLRATISSRLGVKSLDEAKRKSLNDLLGINLAEHYLDGGPSTDPLDYDNVITPTVQKLGIADNALQFVYLWNIRTEKISEDYMEADEEIYHGAVTALEKHGLGKGVKGQANIKGEIWNEILSRGDVIQTWQTEEFTGLGHSFIFLEYVYSSQTTPPRLHPSSWMLYGSSGKPLETNGGEAKKFKTVKTTYTVQAGESDDIVLEKCGFATLEDCKAMNVNNPMFKRGGGDTWFHKGAEIITNMDEVDANSLKQIKGLHLVGMLITDQKGFVFIPKDESLAKKSAKVITNEIKRKRAKWIGESKLWVASVLQ